MISSPKVKALAGIGGVAALVALTASPALAVTPTGSEAILTPVSVPAGDLTPPSGSFTPTNDANGNPIWDTISITGSGYAQASQVSAMVCDGKPETAAGWSPTIDCDNLTATSFVPVGFDETTGGQLPAGNFLLPAQTPNTVGYQPGVFRGESPSDLFNCLAPDDSPTASQASVPNANANGPNPVPIQVAYLNGQETNSSTEPYAVPTIDPTVPSWGSTLPLAGGVGGGTAPCQIRIAYSNVNTSTTSDKEIPITISQDAVALQSPPPSVPESPLTIALPIGGVVLFGAAGAVLYRKRRSATAAA